VLAPEATPTPKPEAKKKPDVGSDVVDDWFDKQPTDQTGPGFENPSMTGFKAKITREHGGISSQASHRENVSGSNEIIRSQGEKMRETQKLADAEAKRQQEQIDLQAKMISADFFKETPDTNPDAWTNPSMTGFDAKRRADMQAGPATIDSPMKGGVEVGQAMRESDKAGRKDVVDTNQKQGFFSKLFGRNQKGAEKGADVIPFPKKESDDAKEEKAA